MYYLYKTINMNLYIIFYINAQKLLIQKDSVLEDKAIKYNIIIKEKK